MADDPRLPLIRYLVRLGFQRPSPHFFSYDLKVGRRNVRVSLSAEDPRSWAAWHHPDMQLPASRFADVAELELAIIFEALRGRKTPWPMTLASP